jgi:hypothetical protein
MNLARVPGEPPLLQGGPTGEGAARMPAHG